MAETARNRPRRDYGQSVAAVLLVLAAVLLTAAVIAMAYFGQSGNTLPEGYRAFSRNAAAWLSAIPNLLPVAAWDIGSAVLAAIAFVLLVVCLWQRKGRMLWLGIVSVLVTATFLGSVVFWGLNFYAPPLAQEVGLSGGSLTKTSLVDAAEYYWDKAAEYSEDASREEDGTLARFGFDETAALVPGAYAALGAQYPMFADEAQPVKPVTLASSPLLYMGQSGFYSSMTGEATVSPDCAPLDMVFEMCHVTAHRLGIAPETDADLAAFLACVASDEEPLEYAAYCEALMFCLDALEAHGLEGEVDLSAPVDEAHALVARDIASTRDYYDSYGGLAFSAGRAAEATYLRAFTARGGVERLDRFASALVAWQQQDAARAAEQAAPQDVYGM